MKPFLDANFLLETKTAIRLYHEFAKAMPIIDYHNHLPPDEIANNKQYQSITEVWLKRDHYKWRAMRANGIHEKFITGDASDREKFQQWAKTVPNTLRNPLFHWTHLELQRYFGIHELLTSDSADSIYDQIQKQLQQPSFFAKGLLKQMNVELVCTTDLPTDDLKWHQKQNQSGDELKMFPTFRPDKFIAIDNADFIPLLEKLETILHCDISTFDQLLAALEDRINYFHANGCRLSDHGLSQLYVANHTPTNLDNILKKRKRNQPLTHTEVTDFQTSMLYHLAKMYHKKGWAMQLHLGAIRDTNSRLLTNIGADVGCDSIGDFAQAEGLVAFLDSLDKEDQLTQTILYNLNPRDNELFATMAGNYNDGSMAGKIQWGSAWWFLDQKDGMEKQINALSNLGLLSQFIGMLTDSRSFLSFPRHEYFRRTLCNLIGNDVENGLLPNDIKWLGETVMNISYRNANKYFEFSL